MRFAFLACSLCAIPVSTAASADPLDPGAARTQLRQGYALKEQGKCDEALPHFVESIRLDKQPKTLLNLADCEEKVGKYVAAQTHAVEARDLAGAQGAAPLKTLAEQRMQSIEKKTPKLVVRLAKDAPAGTTVTRDGVELGAVSLGIPLPVDPGPHAVVARSAQLERQYSVTLTDGATQELEVTSTGGKSLSTTPLATPLETAPDAKHPLSDPQSTPPDAGPSRTSIPVVPIVLGGVGVAGVVVATVFGLKSRDKNQAAIDACPTGCAGQPYLDASQLRDDAKSARTMSYVGAAVGGAALVAGVVVLVVGGSSHSSASGVRIAPSFAQGGAGLELGSTW